MATEERGDHSAFGVEPPYVSALVTDFHSRRCNDRDVKDHTYYVYIMQSVSRRVLYIGMTNELTARVRQHKNHMFEGFTDRYNCTRLVYFEEYQWVQDAIARETQLKKWRRSKKDWLIAGMNPHWNDLAENWGKPFKPLTPIV